MHFCSDEAVALMCLIPGLGYAWYWFKAKVYSFIGKQTHDCHCHEHKDAPKDSEK